jgi:hypothetical protein
MLRSSDVEVLQTFAESRNPFWGASDLQGGSLWYDHAAMNDISLEPALSTNSHMPM